MAKSMKLGGGGRFAKLAAKIGPAAAAAAGRKKYGAKGMAALASKGTAGAATARAEARKIKRKKGK
jgi:hypothetical protein